jgi:hypothetical protein
MTRSERDNRAAKALAYCALCFALWVVVYFGTAGGFRIGYFQKYGLTLLLFYLGYPLLFTFLVFGLKFNERRLLLATLAAIFVVEVVFTRNPLVTSFPACLLGVPLAAAVYAPLTFFPLWIVEGRMVGHIRLVVFLSLIVLAVMCLTTFGSGG